MKFVFFWFFFSCFLFSDSLDYIILKKEFSPDFFNIGDRVSLKIQIKTKSNLSISLSNVLSAPWGVIEKTDVKKISDTVFELKIIFIPYDTGILIMPDINLTDINLKQIDIFVTPLTNDSSKISNSFKPLNIPGTKIFISMVLIGIVVSILILILFLTLSKKLYFILLKYLNQISFKMRISKYLKNMLKDKNDKFIYDKIVFIIKEYLNFIFKKDYSSHTIEEIISDFDKIKDKQLYVPIINLLEKSNNIRFSSKEMNLMDNYEVNQDIRRLKKAIKNISDNIKKINEDILNIERKNLEKN